MNPHHRYVSDQHYHVDDDAWIVANDLPAEQRAAFLAADESIAPKRPTPQDALRLWHEHHRLATLRKKLEEAP